MSEQFLFLKSTRFWAMIIAALSLYLETKGFIGEAERNLIATVMGGFIGIRTIDRSVEKMTE